MDIGLPEVGEESQLVTEEEKIAMAAGALMSLRTSTPLLTPRFSTCFTSDTGIQCSVEKKDFSCQVNAGDFKVPFVDVMDTPKKLATFTGLPSFEKLAALIYIFSNLFPQPNRNSMDTKSRVIMTLIKLKLNWSFAVLATLFSVAPTTCKNIFTQCVYTLSEICRSSIEWPSIEEIRNYLPKCFENFQKVRVVLHCTEIKIAKCKCLKCRILSYSHYKGNHTVKYMIGVTPGGTISFVSNGYGGRASDKKIFEESGIIQLLEPFVDEVMADKGFIIKTLCQENFIGLIQPPFLRKNIRFSKEDALLTSGIAKARVHVERVIERVKKFKILSDAFPPTLIPLVDDIMIIACGMTNMSNPILAEDVQIL